jgi:hypothetical protein
MSPRVAVDEREVGYAMNVPRADEEHNQRFKHTDGQSAKANWSCSDYEQHLLRQQQKLNAEQASLLREVDDATHALVQLALF